MPNLKFVVQFLLVDFGCSLTIHGMVGVGDSMVLERDT